MNPRLLAVTVALIAMAATATPAQAGFGTSPRSHSQEMDHDRSTATAAGVAGPGRIAHITRGASEYGEWIAETERPSDGYPGR